MEGNRSAVGLPLYLGLLARALLAKGALQAASDCLADALRISARNNDCHWDAELYRLRVELALAAEGERLHD